MSSNPSFTPSTLARTLLALVLCWLAPAHAETLVRWGVYDNQPKLFLDEQGRPAGIFADLLQEIAQREGWTLQAVPCDWQGCLAGLANGDIDLMPDVAYNPSRAEVYDFHQVAALHSWSQGYTQNGKVLESILDLNGKRIAVLQGSVQEEYLVNLLDSFGVQARWQPVQALDEAFARVARGDADIAMANHRYGDMQAQRYKLVATPLMFNPVRLYFAARKNTNAQLLQAIDGHLRNWKADSGSPYYGILNRWGNADTVPLVPVYIWWTLAAATALLLVAVGAATWLRREVHRQTGALRASEERLNTILDSVEAYIYIKDPQLRYQYANRPVRELFGRSLEDIVGRTDDAFFDAPTAQKLHDNDSRVVVNGERVAIEEVNRLPGSPEDHVYLSVKLPLRDAKGSIYALCGISTDLTPHRKIQAEVHQLAFYDPLTHLPNRRLLHDRLSVGLAAHLRNQHDGALLFIDLDNFKTLNDTHGHDVGDLLLQQIAQRLQEHIRNEDTLARLGGDEFVVMLQNLSTERDGAALQAEAVAHKIQHSLSLPYLLGTLRHEMSVSIGVTLFSDTNGSPEDALKLADMAMYQAKAEGRNTVCFFDTDMQDRVHKRAELEADLREGLAQSQFFLLFQPQVDAQGRMLGAEALLRWQHPTRGLVPPGVFIGVAETSGLILPLGLWVLQAACQQLVDWAQQPTTAQWTLAVNVSARQFKQPNFVNEVQAVLRQTGANPARLELELTESQLVDDIDSVIAKMSVLRAYGVNFSLDDFGTGYSSLSYLKRLPLYKLKIDQGFVRDLLTDANDAAIVKTVVALGQSLDLAVIAEGVETEAQREALAELGCKQFQGYWFSRPAPASELEQRWGQAGV